VQSVYLNEKKDKQKLFCLRRDVIR